MNHQVKNYSNDYRVNTLNNGTIISVEITCCGKHIGEMRFNDGESRKCPACGTEHFIIIQHNHFHIRSVSPADSQADNLKVTAGEG
jgi:Zn finger protein HypA/HybF involved in hydrogenase expression